MKKTLLNLSMLLLMLVVGMGSAWAQEVVLLEEDFASLASGNSTSSSGSGTSWNDDNDNFPKADRVSAYQAGGAVKLGASKSAGSITTKALDLSVNDGNYIVEFDVKGWTNIEGEIVVTPSNGEAQSKAYTAKMADDFETVSFSFTGGAADTKITIGTSAKRAFIDNVKIYYVSADAPVKTKTTVTYTGDAVNEVNLGDDFTAASFVVDAEDGTALHDIELTYTSSNTDVATVDAEGNVTIVGAGTTAITATYAGDETYAASKASFSLGVYEAYSTLADVIAAAEATTKTVKYTFSGETVTSVVTKDNGNTDVYITDGENTLMIFNASGFEVDDVLKGTVKVQLQVYGGEAEFKYLTTTTDGLTVTRQKSVTITLGEYESELEVNGETSFTVTTDPEGLVVTVTSSNEDVAIAEIDDEGTVTVLAGAEGTATLTFTTEATDEYKAGEKTITIVVTKPFEVEDGVFDFTVGYDYGSECEQSSVKEQTHTWTAGNVEIVTAGRNAWGASSQNLDFRLYKSTSTAAAGSLTVSVPDGNVITGIVIEGSKLTNIEPDNGSYESGVWTGENQTVTFVASETVQITKITVTYESEAGTYTRDVTAGTYGTLCLKSAATVEGAVVYEVAGTRLDETGAVTGVVLVEHEGVLLPRAAYVVLATADQIVATYTDDTANEIPSTGLVGNLTSEAVQVKDGNYVLSDGKLRQVAGGKAYVAPNRAYFDLANVDKYVETAGVKAITIYVEGEDATAINTIATENAAQSGAIYNVNGQLMGTLQRGINIVGGKKVLVK